MFQQFFNRVDELRFLEDSFRRNDANLLVVYGRRRVGKTALVREFIKGRKAVYFLADERGDIQNLREMQSLMSDFLGDELFGKAGFNEWTDLFLEFSKRCPDDTVIVVDEFPYLVSSNKAIPSIFQKIWDLYLSNQRVHLILLGSSISMMEEYTLARRSPLYGRRTGQWKVGPLGFMQMRMFLPKTPVDDLVKTYSVTDGIPAYILQMDPEKSFESNLEESIYAPGAFLYQEAEFLLKQELREKANYFSILKAIAYAKTRFGEIVNYTELDKTLVSKYLDTLINLHIIKKEYPPTLNRKTRNARYVFVDNYYRFWFRFIYPYKSVIEGGRTEQLIRNMQTDLNSHYAFVFEKVCTELLPYTTSKTLTGIGRWWHKEEEIDIVALNDDTLEIIFAECKWKDNVDAKRLFTQLRNKTVDVDWHKGERKEYYVLFAKSFRKKIKEPNLKLYDLQDIERIYASPGK